MIATAPFGRTGHDSTRVIFGAAALGRMNQDRADATLAVVHDAGVNHIDTAAAYGDAELRLAPFLAHHRADVFLATKTGDRTGEAARASLERSLERMGVDAVDLIQLHNLVEEDEWRVATGPGGALESMVRARDEGLVRFIGVTGHGTRIARMHRRSLEVFPFDSVLLPFSYVALRDAAYRADVEELLATCRDRGVAVQAIKSVARRRWPAGHDGRRFSWYEPIRDEAALARAVAWVLAEPDVFLSTTSDATLLPAVLAAASAPGPRPGPEAMEADVAALDAEPLFDGDALERI